MLKVHLKTGETLKFDLQDEEAARAWFDSANTAAFQSSISALTLEENGVSVSLPLPKRLDPTFLYAELVQPNPELHAKGGALIRCFMGDLELVAMVHKQQRAVRLNVTKRGKRRYNPHQRTR